jgi:YHS domain-containing protein
MGEILQRSRASVGKAIPATLAAVSAADMVSDTEVADPVCGMRVQVSGARYISEYEGKTFAFCCAGCKERFDREPEEYGVGLPS